MVLAEAGHHVVIVDYGTVARFDLHDRLNPPDRTTFRKWYALKAAGTDEFPMLWPGPDNPHCGVFGSGTWDYQSPRVKLEEEVSYGTNLWAVGMIIHDWLTGCVSVFVTSFFVLCIADLNVDAHFRPLNSLLDGQ